MFKITVTELPTRSEDGVVCKNSEPIERFTATVDRLDLNGVIDAVRSTPRGRKPGRVIGVAIANKEAK